jgi:hypothetical protein
MTEIVRNGFGSTSVRHVYAAVNPDWRFSTFARWLRAAIRAEIEPNVCANQLIAADRSEVANERDDASSDKIETEMKDFSNASFPPEMIGIMQEALDAAVATLPEPVNSAHVQSIAETILRTARDGERDPNTLQRMALIELQISPRR